MRVDLHMFICIHIFHIYIYICLHVYIYIYTECIYIYILYTRICVYELSYRCASSARENSVEVLRTVAYGRARTATTHAFVENVKVLGFVDGQHDSGP